MRIEELGPADDSLRNTFHGYERLRETRRRDPVTPRVNQGTRASSEESPARSEEHDSLENHTLDKQKSALFLIWAVPVQSFSSYGSGFPCPDSFERLLTERV